VTTALVGAAPALLLALLWTAVILGSRVQQPRPGPRPYVPPPITDTYVADQIAVLEWHLKETP
jgi:hypothetical protein